MSKYPNFKTTTTFLLHFLKCSFLAVKFSLNPFSLLLFCYLTLPCLADWSQTGQFQEGRQYSSRHGKTGHTIPGNYGLCKGDQQGHRVLTMAARGKVRVYAIKRCLKKKKKRHTNQQLVRIKGKTGQTSQQVGAYQHHKKNKDTASSLSTTFIVALFA